MNTTNFGVTDLTATELTNIDGGLVLELAIATYFVTAFLAGVAIGVDAKK